MKHDVSLNVKPVSNLCNLNCLYCGHHEVFTKDCDVAVIKSGTVDALCKKVFDYSQGGKVTFTFIGGEPMLASKSFFEYFCEQADKANTCASPVEWVIKTNGTLIDKEWCDFFLSRDFSVGVSLDGVAPVHNLMRRDKFLRHTFGRVMRGVRLLRENNVRAFGICKVTAADIPLVEKSYALWKSVGFSRVELEFDVSPFGKSKLFALDGNTFYAFCKKLTEVYLADVKKGVPFEIPFIDDFIRKIKGGKDNCVLCGAKGCCDCSWTVDSDGALFPCQFYCDQTHKLCDVDELDFDKLYLNEKLTSFVKSSFAYQSECMSCDNYELCFGGCRRWRDNGNNVLGKNLFCDGLKRYLDYLKTAVSKVV